MTSTNKNFVVVINYGLGNLGSILNMLKKIGISNSEISSDPVILEKADKLILPGVGAFDNGMRNLENMGLIPVLNKLVQEKKVPILGICLGMQLLTEKSEEGVLPGLGWISGETKRFRLENSGLKVPHMGWNTVQAEKEHPLLKDLGREPRYYFVHSYHVCCKDNSDVLLTSEYGCRFTAAVQRDNIIGVQFHPEKSHKFGMKLLLNFCKEEEAP